jgi:signal transduction histidine kinase
VLFIVGIASGLAHYQSERSMAVDRIVMGRWTTPDNSYVSCHSTLESASGPRAMKSRLTNVVHNAIKYPPRRAITTLQVEREEMNSVVISVQNEDPGIASEHAGRIFDRFYRVAGRSREAGASGLGLAIVQWVVQAHKGAIAVSRAPGGGSGFTS